MLVDVASIIALVLRSMRSVDTGSIAREGAAADLTKVSLLPDQGLDSLTLFPDRARRKESTKTQWS